MKVSRILKVIMTHDYWICGTLISTEFYPIIFSVGIPWDCTIQSQQSMHVLSRSGAKEYEFTSTFFGGKNLRISLKDAQNFWRPDLVYLEVNILQKITGFLVFASDYNTLCL